ncbi:hypothetical protein [Acuticoccus sediminis]|uniref:hypothetical protein n=1 Tax=Acuticoccus sediminis TaxID=2184697 RepID=UPI001CFCF2E9|nr:hypothetical protein [Acuticoccus sediminis]
MRSFADTLPTLRDGGASQPPLPVAREAARFNPVFLRKAASTLAAPRGDAAEPVEVDEPDVVEIRRTLLRRQGLEDGPPTDTPAQGPRQALSAAEATLLSAQKAKPETSGPPAAPAAPRGEPRPAAAVVPPFINAGGKGEIISVDRQIAEAVAEARREAEAEKASAVEFARKVERDVAARAVAEARERWCAEESTAFAARCTEAFDALHQRLADAFARALAPIAETAIRDAAVRRFAAVLDDLVGASATQQAVTVRGPAQLVEALKQASGDSGVAFEVAEGETELAVTVDETTLRTTIGAWAETLARTIGGDDA